MAIGEKLGVDGSSVALGECGNRVEDKRGS